MSHWPCCSIAHLDGLRVQFEAVFGDQKLLNIFSLISLKLDDFSHLTIGYDGTIAGELLLDHLEDLLLIEFLGQTLDCSQSLATIALLNSDMDVILTLLFLGSSLIVVGLREGVCASHVSTKSLTCEAWRAAIRKEMCFGALRRSTALLVAEHLLAISSGVAIGLKRGALTKGFEVFDS